MSILFFTLASFLAISSCAIIPEINSKYVQPRIYENEINATIECVKGLLNEGIPEAGIPSFNPLILGNFTADFDSDLLNGKVSVENLELAGITNFVATYLKGGINIVPGQGIGVKLAFTINLDKINLNTEYDADATILKLFPIYGNGRAYANLKDLVISGEIILGLGDSISITGLKLDLSLGYVRIDILGMINDPSASQIFSEAVTDLVRTLFSVHREKLNEVVANIILSSSIEGVGPLLEAFEPCLEHILG